MTKLILASGSPRRRVLIQLLDYPSQVVVSNVDEEAILITDPAAYVMETARQKASAVTQMLADHQSQAAPAESLILVAADTTVALDGEILGKPADADQARDMLRRQRNRDHQVHTGLVVSELDSGRTANGVHSVTVTMRPYTDEEIEAYIATGDPFDKAGAYAIQHPIFSPVATLEGCFLAVVGLSVCHLALLLEDLGIAPRIQMAALWEAHQGFDCPLFNKISGKR